MASNIIAKYRQAALELRAHLKTGRFKTLRPERAFIEWYVVARFGQPASKRVVDGANDGGLDAVIESGGTTYVLQAKYETKPRAALVTRNEIAAFEAVADKFKNRTAAAGFADWLETVDPKLHDLYRRLRAAALRRPAEVRFVFVTTKRSDFGENGLYEIEDAQNIAALWYLYSEGFTPPTEYIDLKLESSWHTSSDRSGYRTYVGLADVRDFLRLMRKDENERLFAQNVRTNLRSKVNDRIRETYELQPDVFWLGNNGIYIVCRKATATGSQFRLTYPSVINGSQTLHAIADSRVSHACRILVRILEMDVLGDPALLSAVIRRTNTQNTMKLINLFAHDPAQLNIARYLDRHRIFYERREKEWQNERKTLLSGYVPVNVKDVAQWISTADARIGLGTARSQVSELFQEATYQRLFGDFDQELKSPAYESLVLMVWAGLFIRNTFNHLSPRTKVYAKISRLLLVRGVYDSVRRSKDLRGLIPVLLEDHRLGRRKIPASIVKSITAILAQAVLLQKKEQKRDPNIDFSNFYKRDDLTRVAYQRACAPRLIAALTSALETTGHDIR